MIQVLVCLLLLAGLFGIPVYYLHETIEREAKCVKYGTHIRSSTWVQVVQVGKTPIPIVHSDKDSLKSVCVEYAQ